ncbi:COMM domain-containing protein 5 [Contarinia nasturtii]|uniref:COMM domain-containing protein 5 n=1 Tax=Contarinia nasturtii TaxID=265458 RepID=UPI0012D3D5C3|nr:COMM domain-containing protein 5 [Contarinia nasturtii]
MSVRTDLLKGLQNYAIFVPQLTRPVLRVLIQVSVHYIESRVCAPEILDLAITKLSQTGFEIPENFRELFSVILQVMQLFLRTPKGSVREEDLRECLKQLNFTDECIGDFSKVLLNYRESLTLNYCDVKSMRSPPKRLQWCINISLMDSGIERIAQPIIVLHIMMQSGEYKTFEIPITMFHRLRYFVAYLLREFHMIESRQKSRK